MSLRADSIVGSALSGQYYQPNLPLLKILESCTAKCRAGAYADKRKSAFDITSVELTLFRTFSQLNLPCMPDRRRDLHQSDDGHFVVRSPPALASKFEFQVIVLASQCTASPSRQDDDVVRLVVPSLFLPRDRKSVV